MGQDVAKDNVRDLLQKKAQDVMVTVYVNSKDLYELNPKHPPPPPKHPDLDLYQAQVDSCCILSDNNKWARGHLDVGSHLKRIIDGKPLSNWESEVYGGRTISWTIKDVDPEVNKNYTPAITGIEKEGGATFWDDLSHKDGIWTAKLKSKIPKGVETYSIKFQIRGPKGKPTEDFTLDPKLGGPGGGQ